MEQWTFRIVKYIKKALDALLSIIYDEDDVCTICGKDTNELHLCRDCLENITYCYDGYEVKGEEYTFMAFSCAYYFKTIKELIGLLKYHGKFRAGLCLSKLMIDKIMDNNIEADLITYVPSSFINYKKRGYNQVKVIASFISNEINIPYKRLLYKKKNTLDQIGLSGLDRWKNIKGSFGYFKFNNIKDKKILLIDDVFTTGATVYYCAAKLKEMGAKDIIILTAAKRGL